MIHNHTGCMILRTEVDRLLRELDKLRRTQALSVFIFVQTKEGKRLAARLNRTGMLTLE